MNRRPNRYNAARDKHDAAIRCPERKPYIKPKSLPLTRVLKWMFYVVIAAIIVDTLKSYVV